MPVMLQRRNANASSPVHNQGADDESVGSPSFGSARPGLASKGGTWTLFASSWAITALVLVTTVVLAWSTLSSGTEVRHAFRSGQSHVRSASPHALANFRPVHDECTVWMAPSSLKGFAGYGVFTTRDLEKDESILGIPDGVAIPVETDWDDDTPKAQEREDWWEVWGNYVWARGVPDHTRFYAGSDVVSYQIGFGALPNHHCLLKSLSYVYPTPPYDDSLVDRFEDPGAGAFTYSRGRQFTVKRPLKAGSEIFLNYGYCEHGGKHEPDWLENVYVTGDFAEASALIWEAIKEGSNNKIHFDNSGNLIPPKNVERLVVELLPQTKEELALMKKAALSKTDLSWYLATHKSLNPHSSDWIQNHGMCLENLRPLPSTLPHAGQGAFAQYAIKRGEIVMPAPLVQIMDKEVLTIYQDGNLVGQQLLLNYCFGHPQSTLLLCPDTQAELINHCSKRTKQCGRKGPNAAIRWSQGWDALSDEWRKKSLEDLAKETGRGLAFEVYALRDILPGEEVFIDYGVEWEQAWKNHVNTYRPPKHVKSWISAKEANDNTEEILPEFISGDLRETVNHPYLFTGCSYYPSESDEQPEYKGKVYKSDQWRSLSDKEILNTFAESGKDYGYWDERGYTKHSDYTHWPCSVLKQTKRGKYIVRIHQNPYYDDTPWEWEGLPRILVSFDRDNIHYFVKPYAADQFLPGVFRHPLGIPNDMFPSQWKNLT